jgi:hypothetical protein
VALRAELTRQRENDCVTITYEFRDVDIAVVEGIFLFKRKFRGRFDLSVGRVFPGPTRDHNTFVALHNTFVVCSLR